MPEAQSQSKAAIVTIIFFYMLSSSTMLIVNKFAIFSFPFPIALIFIQLVSSAVIIWAFGAAGSIEVDPLRISTIKQFYLVVIVFFMNIFTNMKALQYSNVETVIVFRTCTTLAIAYGDWKLLGMGRPSASVIGSILVTIGGAFVYVSSDSNFTFESYMWVSLYFVSQCIDMLYIKHVMNNVPMTNWGRTSYNNILSIPIAITAFFFMTNEKEGITDFINQGLLDAKCITILAISCILGLSISYSGFLCRGATGATSFSVIGNANKILTVLINIVAWDKHATPVGIVGLLISLFGGALYSRAVDGAKSPAPALSKAELPVSIAGDESDSKK